MALFPEIGPAWKALRSGFGTDPITLQLKGASASFDTVNVPDVDWYQRNGYYGLAQALSGYGSAAGINVTGDRALEISGFFSGVKIISQDMGTLPFFTYERGKNRDTIRPYYEHPLYSCLHDLVNPEISSGEFVECLTGHALLTGNGLAKIQRQGDSIFLWPWQPGDTRTDKDSRGMLYYIHKDSPGVAEKSYPRRDVFHLRGFTLNGTVGDDLLRRGRQILGLASAMQDYSSKYFRNDATPGVVVQFPIEAPPINPEGVVAFKKKWAEWHRGNPHEPAILQQGGTISRVATNAAESQLIEQRKFQLLEVCRLLNLPPHRLADLDRSNLANIEQMAIEYGKFTIMPWKRRWRDAVYRCLLTTDEQAAGRIYAEHSIEALQQGDFTVQAEGWRKLLEKGVYSINEVRKWQNLNPVQGGDEHFIQLNLGTVQDVASGLTLHPVAAPDSTTPALGDAAPPKPAAGA